MRTRPIRFLFPALAVLMLAGAAAVRPVPAGAQPGGDSDQFTGVRVRGQGTVTARPDVAFLSLGTSVLRDTPGAAFDTASGRIATLTEALRANGVAENDIQTRELSLFPEYRNLPPPAPGEPPPPPQLVGWRARYFVAAKIRDFTRLGGTVDAAVRALGEEAVVQGISFGIEDTDALVARARDEAVSNARAKAEQMAARAGARLGRLISLEEISSPGPTPVRAPTAVPAPQRPAAAAPAEAPVSPGEQTITVIVEAVWAIE